MIIEPKPATTHVPTPAAVPAAVPMPALTPSPVPALPVTSAPQPILVPAPSPTPALIPVPIPAPAPVPAAPMGLVRPPEQLPAYIELATGNQVAAGFENSTDEGLRLPMLCLAQPLSKAVVERRTLQAGDVYSSLEPDKRLFGTGQSVSFVPFFHFKEYISWKHRDLGGGMVNKSMDPKGEIAMMAMEQLSRRGQGVPTGAEQPIQAYEYHVFFALLAGALTEPVAIPLCKTKFKKGRLLLQLARARGPKVPLFGGKYTITPVQETNPRGVYFNFNFAPDGHPTKEEYEIAKQAHGAAEELYKQLDYTETESEPVVDAAAPTPGATPAGY